MRLDALKLAVTFYEKTGQKEKARLYGEFVERDHQCDPDSRDGARDREADQCALL